MGLRRKPSEIHSDISVQHLNQSLRGCLLVYIEGGLDVCDFLTDVLRRPSSLGVFADVSDIST